MEVINVLDKENLEVVKTEETRTTFTKGGLENERQIIVEAQAKLDIDLARVDALLAQFTK